MKKSAVPKKILLIKLRHHGDILLTTPVINALRQHYPEAVIDMLIYKESCPLVKKHPAINQFHLIDHDKKHLEFFEKRLDEIKLIQAVYRAHYDIVINLADQWSSAIVTGLSGASTRIGFDFSKRRHLFWRLCHNIRVSTDNHDKLHTVEQNMSALMPLGINLDSAEVTVHYSEADQQQITYVLAQYAVTDKFIVIQPTSRWMFKCWEDEKVATLIDSLIGIGKKVILTASAEKTELEQVEKILSLCTSTDVISLAGQLTLTQLAALIDRAELFIGVDSAPMHIAAALKTPCLALFGPSKTVHWRPWGKNNRFIWAGNYAELPDPDCIDTRTSQRYLSAIPVEDVLTATLELTS